MRRFFCIFLLMLLPLHSFGMQGAWLSSGSAYDLSHELVHQEGINHHHGDDGVIHYDDSSESAQHISDHTASGQSATLPASATPLSPMSAFIVVASERRYFDIPNPHLERPQRPPSSLG